VQCGECRAVNFRGDERCQECGAALKWVVRGTGPRVDRQLWPLRWSFDRRRRWLIPVQMGLFIASVGLATYAAITIAEYRRPRPNTDPPKVFVLEDGKLKPIEEVVKP
jgi:hypothetical protein